jgi:Spy/CpxP family protein refolding chaperone
MTDTGPTPSPTPAAPPPSDGRRHSRRRWLGFGIAGAVGAALASVVTLGFGGHRGWHGHHRGLMTDPARLDARVEKGVNYVLGRVDATAEQKQKVAALLRAAIADLRPLRDGHLAGRRQIQEALAAPTVDRARLEALRAAQMQLGEQASKRLVAALADTAEALTPEQRARLARLVDERLRRRRC